MMQSTQAKATLIAVTFDGVGITLFTLFQALAGQPFWFSGLIKNA